MTQTNVPPTVRPGDGEATRSARGPGIAARFDAYGQLTNVTLHEMPEPVPGPGQVRIAAYAAGLNPIDWKIVRGLVREMHPVELPAGLGGDVSGVIDAVGEGVSGFEVGEEVFGRSASPAFATSVLANAASLLKKPPEWSWEQAAALPGVGGAAWLVVDKLALQPGETVLIHAAAGGVGVIATQIARARGANVIGTASEANFDLLRRLGAQPVLYGEHLREQIEAVSPHRVDAVLDLSGRGEIPLSLDLVADAARIVTTKAFDQAATGIQIHLDGCGSDAAPLASLLGLLAPGWIQVPIWRTYSLSNVTAALEASMNGHLGGKIGSSIP